MVTQQLVGSGESYTRQSKIKAPNLTLFAPVTLITCSRMAGRHTFVFFDRTFHLLTKC